MNPNFGEAYSKLGSEYVNSNEIIYHHRIKMANEYHQYAIKLQSKNADFLNNYGAFLCQIGKEGQAIEMYKKALQFNTNHKKAKENLNQLINR